MDTGKIKKGLKPSPYSLLNSEKVKDSTYYWLSINNKKEGKNPLGEKPTPNLQKKTPTKVDVF